MEEIDKLFQLYESDNVELMWQLAEGLDISKFDMIKLLFDEYSFINNLDNTIFNYKYGKKYIVVIKESGRIYSVINLCKLRHPSINKALLTLIKDE